MTKRACKDPSGMIKTGAEGGISAHWVGALSINYKLPVPEEKSSPSLPCPALISPCCLPSHHHFQYPANWHGPE